MERWITGASQPFAPRFDVEELDDDGYPIAVVATGVGAEDARVAIAKLDGVEVR